MSKDEFISNIVSRLACEYIFIDKKTCEACLNIALLFVRTEVLEDGSFLYPEFGELKLINLDSHEVVNFIRR